MADTTNNHGGRGYGAALSGILASTQLRSMAPPVPPGQERQFSRRNAGSMLRQMSHVENVRMARAEGAPDDAPETDMISDVVLSRGATVLRYDYWDGEYFEEVLPITEQAIDMSRLNDKGVTVLDSHASYRLGNAIGRTIPGTARIDATRAGGPALVCQVRWSTAPGCADEIHKIREGTVVDGSIGYVVTEWTKTESKGEISTWTAERYTIMEFSMCCIPADAEAGLDMIDESDVSDERSRTARTAVRSMVGFHPSAGVRSLAAEFNKQRKATEAPAQTAERTQENMEMADTPPTAPAIDAAARAAIIAEERTRSTGITSAARTLGIADAFRDQHIRENTSLDAFYRLATDELARIQAESTPSPQGGRSSTVNETSPNEQAILMVDAFVATARGAAPKDERANQYIEGRENGFDVHELVRESFKAANPGAKMPGMRAAADIVASAPVRHTGATRSAIGMIVPSDFGGVTSLIVGTVASASYADQAAEVQYDLYTRRRIVNDFKQVRVANFGSFSSLEKVTANGRLVHLKTSTIVSRGGVEDFGGKVFVDRKFLYDNDSEFLQDLGRNLGASAKADEAVKAVETLLEGKLIIEDEKDPSKLTEVSMWDDPEDVSLEDGGNTVVATSLYEAMPLIRQALYEQKAPGSDRRANYRLRTIVVSSDLAEQAAQLQRVSFNTTTGSANTSLDAQNRPLYNYVVEPDLPYGTAFGFAGSDLAGALAAYRLRGYDTADVFQIPHPEQLGMGWGVLNPMGFGFTQKAGVVRVLIVKAPAGN